MKIGSLYAKLPLLLVLGVFLIVAYGCKKEKEQEKETSFTFTDSRDGVTYKAVRIGKQVWMAENLKYLPSVSVTAAGSEAGPHYYVYGYNGTDVEAARATANYRNYGVLYYGPAAMGACPQGWRLPGNDEWAALVDFVVSQGYPDQWDSPFGATSATPMNAGVRYIFNDYGNVYSSIDGSYFHGLSVRCIRESSEWISARSTNGSLCLWSTPGKDVYPEDPTWH